MPLYSRRHAVCSNAVWAVPLLHIRRVHSRCSRPTPRSVLFVAGGARPGMDAFASVRMKPDSKRAFRSRRRASPCRVPFAFSSPAVAPPELCEGWLMPRSSRSSVHQDLLMFYYVTAARAFRWRFRDYALMWTCVRMVASSTLLANAGATLGHSGRANVALNATLAAPTVASSRATRANVRVPSGTSVCSARRSHW